MPHRHTGRAFQEDSPSTTSQTIPNNALDSPKPSQKLNAEEVASTSDPQVTIPGKSESNSSVPSEVPTEAVPVSIDEQPRTSPEDQLPNIIHGGLEYLARQQSSDGSWSFTTTSNPGKFDAKNSATAMALLVFVRAGHTHESGQFKSVVNKGLAFLGKQMQLTEEGGSLWELKFSMYGQALAATVFCEAYSRTRDVRLKKAGQEAVNFIVNAQDPASGGWRYIPRQEGDTSVLGWQMSALSLAREVGLRVPFTTFSRANDYLDSVQTPDGLHYGYNAPTSDNPRTTAIGLYTRLLTGRDKGNGYSESVEMIHSIGPTTGDIYFDYYGSLLFKELGGKRWAPWRTALASAIIERQDTNGGNAGSWHFSEGAGGGVVARFSGRLGVTCLCLMTLEILEPDLAEN